ncbi:hypothetical protein ACLB2K_002431 [Fragaria x ananassa]
MQPPLNWEEGFYKILKWFLEALFDSENFEKILTICWQIWKARNDVVFRKKTPNTMNITAAAAYHLGSLATIERDWIKINFDGLVRRNAASGGFILRSDPGKPLVATAFNIGTTSILVVEALALRNSLACAKERGYTKIEVEGDSKLVIDGINGTSDPPWRLLRLFHDIRKLSYSYEAISYKHVFREANFVADSLANLRHRVESHSTWEDCVPPEAALALVFDNVNSGCPRGTSIL